MIKDTKSEGLLPGMKIIYLANVRIPTEKAYGIQIMKMCEAFAQQGVEVKLVVPTRVSQEFKGVDPYSYHRVNRIFAIEKLKTFDPYWLMKLPFGLYIKFQSLFFVINIFFQYLLKKNFKGSILYTRDEYLLPVLSRLSKDVIWESHNLPRNKKRYLPVWQKCKKIIAITEGLKADLVGLGINQEKIIVAPDGVDLKEFSVIKENKEQLRKKINLPAEKNIIMYCGHLYEWKGAQILAQAADLLSSNELVVFVGGTDYDIKKFKIQNKDRNNILVLGRKPYAAIPVFLKAADILVLPNLADSAISSRYTSPLKLFEYLAAGKPVVASDLPSLREILNSENSILVTPGSPDDLAEGIRKLIANPELSKMIAEKALVTVKDYTWDKRAIKILDFIAE